MARPVALARHRKRKWSSASAALAGGPSSVNRCLARLSTVAGNVAWVRLGKSRLRNRRRQRTPRSLAVRFPLELWGLHHPGTSLGRSRAIAIRPFAGFFQKRKKVDPWGTVWRGRPAPGSTQEAQDGRLKVSEGVSRWRGFGRPPQLPKPRRARRPPRHGVPVQYILGPPGMWMAMHYSPLSNLAARNV
jgi:hypothetical protein